MSKPEFIARQSRRPTGVLGRIVARVMARETRTENAHAIDLLNLRDGESLIDIGCGHGEALFQAHSRTRLSASVGVDFSEVMLKRARSRNRSAVRDTRLAFMCADTSALLLPDDRFDKALSVHTVYFWPDPADHLAEAFRVLRPGGRFVLCYRSTADKLAVDTFPGTVYRFSSVLEVEKMMEDAGFFEIKTTTDDIGPRLTHWTVAKKP